MRTASQERYADDAALGAYDLARSVGAPHERAFSAAILKWMALCDWADGRDARLRVLELLLRTRALAPNGFEDWVILAAGSEAWQQGPRRAIQSLSVECRGLARQPEPARAVHCAVDFEAVTVEP